MFMTRALAIVPNCSINRYYDPTTGMFFTVDPDVSQTGQPYLYAGDDPVNGVDPFGLWGWNPISDVTEVWNDTGGKVVHVIATHTVGLCLNVGTGWGLYGTATGCIAFSGGKFTLVGTAGGGGSSPTASVTGGLLFSNATQPGQLRGGFGFAGGSATIDGLAVGDEFSVGNGECNAGIWEDQLTVGPTEDIGVPFEIHGGATYTWTWSP
jgi:hypothetical protein